MNSINVLIIEDDETLARELTEKLNLNGFTVQYVLSGEDGLRKIRLEKKRQFDSVICDLRLEGGIYGDEVYNELQKTDPNICFIMLTGYGTIDSAVSLVKNGAHHYFQKPFQNNQFDEFFLSIRRGVTSKKIRKFEEKVLTTVDLDDLFKHLVDAIETIFSPRNLGMAIIEKEFDGKFRITRHTGHKINKTIVENNNYVNIEGFIKTVFEKPEPLLVKDINCQNYKEILPLSEDSKSLLAVPLIVLNNFYGLLEVEGIKDDDFTNIELDTIKWFGNAIATALHNYRLHNRILDETINNYKALMHQSKMPLHNIQLTVSHLLDGIETKPKQQIKEGIERVYRYSVEAEEMAKDVLTNYKDEESLIDLSLIFENVKRRCKDTASKHNIVIEWPENIYCKLSCKADQLAFVFQTIIENGIDAINKEEIGNGRIKIVVDTNKPNLGISFHDNGCGIEDYNKDKILNRIFSTKPDTTGSGIGLFLSNSFIEGHDGNIKYTSVPGDTRFYVTLPMKTGT